MPSANDCWGIEVGANALKAIELKRSGGEVTVANFEVIPHKQLLTSDEVDRDETIRVALDQLLAKHDLRRTTNVISVPGHAAFARFAKLPPVEPKQIPDIVKYEAVQQIPFPIDQVEWDYQTFADADSPDVEVGIFAMTKDRLLPWLANFHDAGVPIHGVTLSPLAVFNSLSYDLALGDTRGGTIIMDIGTQSTDLVIHDAGRVWLRTIPIGGNRFTDALVRQFKLSFAKAEKLKREASSSKYARQIFQAMRPVFVDLVQEVQKSLGYYQSLNRDSEVVRLVGLGSTFRLSGLQTFLKQQLQIDVHRLDAFKKVDVEGKAAASFADNALSLAPAYGMALQGLEMEIVSCNLLPTAAIRKQVWSAKQPWFIGAAAIVLIGAGLAYYSAYSARSAYNSQENAQKRNQIRSVVARAEAEFTKWRDVGKQQNPTGRIENLIQMLAYRDVWPGVMRDIDGAALAIEPQQALLDGDAEAIRAIPRDQRRQIVIEQINVTYGSGAESNRERLTDWDSFQPGYRIQITGTTPMANPAALLEEKFIGYLVEHADQPDREYTIDLDPGRDVKPEIVKITPILVEEEEEEKPDTNFDLLPRGRRDEVATDSPMDLLPQPMLADESPQGDSRFTIEWRITLRDPAKKPTATEPAEDEAPEEVADAGSTMPTGGKE